MNTRHDKTITEDEVRRVAKLSRLELDGEQIGLFRAQLAHILEYVAQLDEVNIEGVLPTTHVLSSMKNVFRDDEPKPSLSSDEALSNAPARHEDLFKVPKVIKDA